VLISPRLLSLFAAVALAGCGAGMITRQSMRPIPEMPPAPAPEARGSAEAASRIGDENQVMIIREVVRRFFRPLRGQARWIDPQPLAHRRSRGADSAMALEENWVLDIVTAVGLTNVCPLTEGNLRCRGMPGTVLRFSEPYSAGPDSAVVYALPTAVQRGETPRSAPGSEIEFHLARRDGAWTIVNRRTLYGAGAR
jgi:hypothetical protein